MPKLRDFSDRGLVIGDAITVRDGRPDSVLESRRRTAFTGNLIGVVSKGRVAQRCLSFG
jgi:hypothetical protein